jgi:hypothetical protein
LTLLPLGGNSPAMKALFAAVILLPGAAFAQDDGKLTIEIPATVQATIARERGDSGKIADFKKVNEADGTTYVVGIMVGTTKYVVSLDAAGRLMRKQLDVDESGPKELGIESVPAKVRQTFQREAGAGALGTIEVQEAKTTYVTEVVIGKRKYRIEVDAEGTLRNKEYVGDDEG